MGNDDLTIILNRPIEHGGQTITEVKLREIYGKDLRCMDRVDGDNAKKLKLISELSDLSVSAIDKMHISDIMEVSEVLDRLMEKSRVTGDRS